MTTSVSDKTKEYKRRFKKYGISPKSLRWKNQKSIDTRYRVLLEDIDLNGKSLLDVGCGFGDIARCICSINGCMLTGVDIIPEFVEVAKSKYPQYTFLARDYFRHPIAKKFDIVVTSGTLNANIPNAIDFRKKAIKTMWEHAKEVLAFNMAGGDPQPKNKASYGVYYADLGEISDFCDKLTSKVKISNGYAPSDFSIVMCR